MPVYPGDPEFLMDELSCAEAGDSVSMKMLHLCNHTGTHIDFPAHFIAGGKTSSDFSLEYLSGPCRVIEISDILSEITAAEIPEDLKPQEMVFFKTRNTKLTEAYDEKHVALAVSAAKALKAKKIKLVGIDYFSIDSAAALACPVHVLL